MKQQSKLSQEQEQNQAAEVRSQTPREFANVEELLRHDAAQIAVPDDIAKRLQKSVAEATPPARSWWRKLLGL